MAQKVLIQLVDDLDGTELRDGSGETIQFGLDGKTYEIDLSKANATRLRATLGEYIDAGRPVQTRGRRGGAASASRAQATKREDLQEIRDWARANGYTVSDRGRIAQNIVEAYDNR